MFQREVAERIVAEVGSNSYGRLSVLVQWPVEEYLLFVVVELQILDRLLMVAALVTSNNGP
jgi:16S rRNA A1518/A1519 N6-dimethyltransferase RsmA/KsgA/DIM1 with predicted DNA glycosylase/AP lyase activity